MDKDTIQSILFKLQKMSRRFNQDSKGIEMFVMKESDNTTIDDAIGLILTLVEKMEGKSDAFKLKSYPNPCHITIYKGTEDNYTILYPDEGYEYYCNQEELLDEIREHIDLMEEGDGEY